jgi:hypothetical protein
MTDHQPAFSRNDPAYGQWLAAHQDDGFVLHGDQELHRASCPDIAWDANAEDDLEELWVSTRLAQLEYAALVLGSPFYCERCSPPRDVRGVQMHAEYARNMRAKIAKMRES